MMRTVTIHAVCIALLAATSVAVTNAAETVSPEAPGVGTDAAAPAGTTDASAPEDSTARPEPASEPSEDDDALAAELAALAQAWADGGGTFGFAFWDKAGQRWRAGVITDSMYREYVSGYRDQIELGCELLDGVDTSQDSSSAVRDLVLSACRRRVDGLRSSQRALELAIDGLRAGSDGEVAEAEAAIVEQQQEADEALQESFRDARIAMDLAQGALDSRGLERLSEDAFV